MVPEQISKLTIGCRIELTGHKGTVRYIGEVINTKNDWLGIDWDDPSRGKHDGSYEGTQYFKTWHPTSGSFVRPGKVNLGMSVVEAVKKRYGLIEETNTGLDVSSMVEVQREINAKFFQVVGAEKLNRKQSDFHNLQVVLLRDELVSGAGPPPKLDTVCPNITELDLSSTLLNSWSAVADIVANLKRLVLLNLSDNRLEIPDSLCREEDFATVQHLVLGRMNYDWDECVRCADAVANVTVLQVPFNRIRHLDVPPSTVFRHLNCLDLEGNSLRCWSEVNKLGGVKTLELLNLTRCDLQDVHLPDSDLFPRLQQLILTDNHLDSWTSVSELDKLQSLLDFKFRENPVLAKENLETNRQLVVVRIKNLKVFNGLRIVAEERRGAEFDFLKRHGLEWLAIKTQEQRDSFNQLYPCYQRLVDKWGPPEESELNTNKTTSLKSQLIQVEIISPDHGVKSFSKKVPYNMSVQKLAGLIQRLFNTGYEVPRLSCIHSKWENVEVPLDNEMKDLNFYSIENGDKITVRW